MRFLHPKATESTEPIYQELQIVFENVFGKAIPRIIAATSAKDIKRWDSLTHLNLILAIEERFGTRFEAEQIRSFRTVGDVAALLVVPSNARSSS